MLIVDANLKSLIERYKIAPESCYDITCISLTLDDQIIRYNVPKDAVISYEEDNMDLYSNKSKINKKDGYTLQPQECVLACSAETIHMPHFCFGMLQTKGSLARLFVFANCSDGQVDPGYNGKLTFELINASNFPIRIKPGQAVCNLYLFKTTTSTPLYNGKYQNASHPTISK